MPLIFLPKAQHQQSLPAARHPLASSLRQDATPVVSSPPIRTADEEEGSEIMFRQLIKSMLFNRNVKI